MLDTGRVPERPAEDRLDSWKAIAAYLGRDVSTVRRWERAEGLPVHRHRHAARGSAYAYKSEVDRWFESRRNSLGEPGQRPERNGSEVGTPEREAESPSARTAGEAGVVPSRRPVRAVTFAIAVSAVVAAGLAVFTHARSSVSSTRLHTSDWILVGEIDNRTGDPRLNDSVQYALERDLSESAFVNVVSPERVDDTLRLMRKPPDTRIDRATGLEVALRDGGIRALLTGRIEKFGPAYAISTMVVDPADSGRTIVAADARAADDSRILDAVHELSGRIRRALGEDALNLQSAPSALEHVTTRSLQALELYTEGIHAVNQFEWRVGAELLQRAVDEDTDFAAARIYLAYCLLNIGRPPDEYMVHAREAARLAEHQVDREQYFILASYQQMTGNLDKAATLYEALLKLHPDHYWAVSNLFGLYSRLDKRAELWPVLSRLTEARPNDFGIAVRAIQAGLAAGISLDQIDAMAAHARQLTPNRALPEQSLFLDFLPASEAWLRGDTPAMIRLAEAIGRQSPQHAKGAALLELAAGRVTAAQALLGTAGDRDEDGREGDLALLAYFRGDKRALASHTAAAERNYGSQLTLIVWLAMQSDPHEAERFFRDWSTRPDDGHSPLANSAWADAVKAEFRLHRGDTNAMSEFGRAARLTDPTRPRHLRAVEVLADALAMHGDFADSAAVLEDATRTKASALSNSPTGETFGGVFWLRLRTKLARVYRHMGRAADADRIEGEVRKMLAFADPDFKLLP